MITNRESLQRYFTEIKKYPYKDSGSRDELITGNLRYVISVAKEYQHRGLSLPDLIGEGNLGLIKAAETFDETKGFKFITYAVRWIRWEIQRALLNSHVVRLPQSQIGLTEIKSVSLDSETDSLLDVIPAKEERIEIDLSPLTEKEKELVNLYFGDDMGLPEIADRFGVSYVTTYRMKEKILEKLRNEKN